MFLKINKFMKTVTFRTAFYYSLLSTLSLIIIFTVIYLLLEHYITNEIDSDMSQIVSRISDAYSGLLFRKSISVDSDNLKNAPSALLEIARKTRPDAVIYRFEPVQGKERTLYEFEAATNEFEFGILLDSSGHLLGIEKTPISKGMKAVEKEIKYQKKILGSSNYLFCIFDKRGEIIIGRDSVLASIQQRIFREMKLSNDGTAAFCRTVIMPDHKDPLRLIVQRFPDGSVLIVAHWMDKEKKLLINYLKVVSFSLVVMLCASSMLGYWIASRAMHGVRRVASIADRITQENIRCRVPLLNEGEEVTVLVNSFNRMLERIGALIQELSEVTDNLAHDLKTPITGIRGRVESLLIQQSELTQETAVKILEDCDMIISIIDTTLETAELAAGIKTLGKSTVELNAILSRAHELFSSVAEEKGLRFNISIPEEPLIVMGDKRKLQQIIANLIDNAIKYTDSGEVGLSAEIQQEYIVVTVNDSGRGIAEDEQNRVFEKFYRCDHSRSRPGYGLGLSFVKAVTDAYGWQIQISSIPARGTTIKLLIPVLK